ncbi:F-box protein KIB2 [Arabidopsis thaliana]
MHLSWKRPYLTRVFDLAVIQKKQKKEMSDSEEKKCNDDSKQPVLILDLLRSILERLSFVDFHRGRCISLEWYSASESCLAVKNPTSPWIILFPSENVESKNDSCKLYNPRDHSSYIVRDLGFDLARSRCLASSGSWFLMLDHRTDFHILNLFTRVRIPLPPLESTGDGNVFKRVYENVSDGSCIKIDNAVLWVDEKRRDYLVVWNISRLFGYHKKGDENYSWKVFKPLKKNDCCIDMAFKENKLYVLSVTRKVTVYDFSGGDSPVKCATFPSLRFRNGYSYNTQGCHYKVAVTLSGEVLIIVAKVEPYPRVECFFAVYKMDHNSSGYERISLGGEALLLDLGITVEAKYMKNCIYFSNDQFHRYNGKSLCDDSNKNGICVYHIRSRYVVQVFEHLTASSTIPFKDARWFFPIFGGKWLL